MNLFEITGKKYFLSNMGFVFHWKRLYQQVVLGRRKKQSRQEANMWYVLSTMLRNVTVVRNEAGMPLANNC